jgi:flagellar basal-body rod protein FlgC
MRNSLTTIIFIMCIPIYCDCVGLQDSIDISASAMRGQSKRMSVIAQNIANENATSIHKGGDPYRRKLIFLRSRINRKTGVPEIVVDKIKKDLSDFKIRFDPNHPAADERGYVKFPNVDRNIENLDISEARRSYEANMKALEISKNMISRTFEILK